MGYNMYMLPVTPSDITALIPRAREAIGDAAYRTPLEPSAWLAEVTGADVRLKLECYQPTGSFKVRGAMAAIAQLSLEERGMGVVTASAGNHGLGVAYAASRLGVEATVIVPDDASEAKVAALRRFPINLQRGGSSYDTAERAAVEMAYREGLVFISPYNNPWVIAGQATIGVEVLEDLPELDAILIPVGGGGMISGIGSWFKALNPKIRVIGVQSTASPAMERALKAGKLVEIPILPSLADGLAANIQPGSITFELARQVMDEIVLVSEDQIEAAVKVAFHELHLALEGSAVVGIAALLDGGLTGIAGSRVAVVVTGRNIATQRLMEIIAKT